MTILHTAGNGEQLTTETVKKVIEALERKGLDYMTDAETDAVRLIRFLVHVIEQPPAPIVITDPATIQAGEVELGPLFEYPNVAHDGRGWPIDAEGVAIAAAALATQPAANQPAEVLPANDEDLAMALCEADGHDPHEMTYHFIEPGVQEPYGDRWNHYVPQATRLRAALAIQPATSQEGEWKRWHGGKGPPADYDTFLRRVKSRGRTSEPLRWEWGSIADERDIVEYVATPTSPAATSQEGQE